MLNLINAISELLNQNDISTILDEQLSEGEKRDLLEAEVICRRFLEWDLSALIQSKRWNGIRNHLTSITGLIEHDMM
jgi:DNA mismatch repair protein MSH5